MTLQARHTPHPRRAGRDGQRHGGGRRIGIPSGLLPCDPPGARGALSVWPRTLSKCPKCTPVPHPDTPPLCTPVLPLRTFCASIPLCPSSAPSVPPACAPALPNMHPLDVRQVSHCPIPPTAVTSLSPVSQVPISLHDSAVPHPSSHPNPPLTFPRLRICPISLGWSSCGAMWLCRNATYTINRHDFID